MAAEDLQQILEGMLERADLFYYFERGEFHGAQEFLEAVGPIADQLADIATLATVGHQIYKGLSSDGSHSPQSWEDGPVVAGMVHDWRSKDDILKKIASEGVFLKEGPPLRDPIYPDFDPQSKARLPRYVVTDKEWVIFSHVGVDTSVHRRVTGEFDTSVSPDSIMVEMLKEHFLLRWEKSNGRQMVPQGSAP